MNRYYRIVELSLIISFDECYYTQATTQHECLAVTLLNDGVYMQTFSVLRAAASFWNGTMNGIGWYDAQPLAIPLHGEYGEEFSATTTEPWWKVVCAARCTSKADFSRERWRWWTLQTRLQEPRRLIGKIRALFIHHAAYVGLCLCVCVHYWVEVTSPYPITYQGLGNCFPRRLRLRWGRVFLGFFLGAFLIFLWLISLNRSLIMRVWYLFCEVVCDKQDLCGYTETTTHKYIKFRRFFRVKYGKIH